jgi:hypothetical protein
MGFQLVLGGTNGLLVRRVSENNDHQQARDQGHEYDYQKWQIDSKKIRHEFGNACRPQIIRE